MELVFFRKALCSDSIQELCGKGGILRLAQAILKLNSTPYFNGSPRVVAAVSRMKSKVLSIVSTDLIGIHLNILLDV